MPSTWCKTWSTTHGHFRLTSLRWDISTGTVEAQWEDQREEQSVEEVPAPLVPAPLVSRKATRLRARTLALYKKLVKRSKKLKGSTKESTSSGSSGK